VLVRRPAFIVAHDAPNRDAKRREERKHGRHERVEDEPAQARVPLVAGRVRDDLVDVEVGRARLVAAEAAREDEPHERDALVGRGEDPSLEDAARGGEARRPAPHDFVQLLEEDHDERDLEEAIQIAQVGRQDKDLCTGSEVSGSLDEREEGTGQRTPPNEKMNG